MTKWKTIGVKVTLEQEKLITEKAFQSNMTKSEYIRSRLFEDNDIENKKIRNYERTLLSSSVKSFWILQNIHHIISDLNSKDKQSASNRIAILLENSDKYLVEEGYKTEEEFDKIYNK